MEVIKRQTAYKVWLKDITSGRYIRQTGEWEPNYIEINDIKVSRINIIATVIFKHVTEDNAFSSLTLDDGSSTIRAKAWKEDIKIVDKFNVADLVNIIGKIKEYNGEIYIQPEIVSKVYDPNWEVHRKLELLKLYGKHSKIKPVSEVISSTITQNIEQQSEETIVSEEVIEEPTSNGTETDRQKIINLIEKLSTEEGTDKQSIIEQSSLGSEKTKIVIENLLREGEI